MRFSSSADGSGIKSSSFNDNFSYVMYMKFIKFVTGFNFKRH
jgi:hypothetical protein